VSAERTELAKAYLDVQAMQHSTYFESAEARVLDQPLRRLTQAAVELCTTAEAAVSHRAGSLLHPEKNHIARHRDRPYERVPHWRRTDRICAGASSG
jgi:hypothetical protein